VPVDSTQEAVPRDVRNAGGADVMRRAVDEGKPVQPDRAMRRRTQTCDNLREFVLSISSDSGHPDDLSASD
jgi:hypothetical protein